MLLIPAFRENRGRKIFKVSLDSRVSSMTPRATQRNPVSKNKMTTTKPFYIIINSMLVTKAHSVSRRWKYISK